MNNHLVYTNSLELCNKSQDDDRVTKQTAESFSRKKLKKAKSRTHLELA